MHGDRKSSQGDKFELVSDSIMAKKSKKNKNKILAEFKKKYDQRTRKRDFTRDYEDQPENDEQLSGERVSGKGHLTKRRTIKGSQTDESLESSVQVQLDINESDCHPGKVLSVHGLVSFVEVQDGTVYPCSMRGILKSLSTDQRNTVVTGDEVLIRLLPGTPVEGVIERVEPRHGVISRVSRNRRHVIAANVDCMVIVGTAAQPDIKPNLIDRFVITAERSGITPVICINKIDLVEPAGLQPLIGVFGKMGYQVLLTSVTENIGIDWLRAIVQNKKSVIVGQSGVGKSSILNAIEPGLALDVGEVSRENDKGRHTTTASKLVKLSMGGYIVDTPGIRQFQLWDIISEEVAGFFRDIRPYVSLCRFPDCTHTHELDCAVKNGVADGRIDARRYYSYCQIQAGEMV